MSPSETVIWLVLSVLGYFTAHTVTERLLFHIGCRTAKRQALEEFLGQLRKFRSLNFTKPLVHKWSTAVGFDLRPTPLGWLTPHVVEANGSRAKLRSLLHEFEYQPSRFSEFQATMVNVGAALGLTGTVLAFVQLTGGQDFSKLMGLAFQTTLAGLVISIPAQLAYGLLTPRANRILDQVDLVLEVLDASEQPEECSPFKAMADSLCEGLSEAVSLLQGVAHSHQEVLAQQQELIGALCRSRDEIVEVGEVDSVGLVPVGATSAVSGARRINGHKRRMSKGQSNEVKT